MSSSARNFGVQQLASHQNQKPRRELFSDVDNTFFTMTPAPPRTAAPNSTGAQNSNTSRPASSPSSSSATGVDNNKKDYQCGAENIALVDQEALRREKRRHEAIRQQMLSMSNSYNNDGHRSLSLSSTLNVGEQEQSPSSFSASSSFTAGMRGKTPMTPTPPKARLREDQTAGGVLRKSCAFAARGEDAEELVALKRKLQKLQLNTDNKTLQFKEAWNAAEHEALNSKGEEKEELAGASSEGRHGSTLAAVSPSPVRGSFRVSPAQEKVQTSSELTNMFVAGISIAALVNDTLSKRSDPTESQAPAEGNNSQDVDVAGTNNSKCSLLATAASSNQLLDITAKRMRHQRQSIIEMKTFLRSPMEEIAQGSHKKFIGKVVEMQVENACTRHYGSMAAAQLVAEKVLNPSLGAVGPASSTNNKKDLKKDAPFSSPPATSDCRKKIPADIINALEESIQHAASVRFSSCNSDSCGALLTGLVNMHQQKRNNVHFPNLLAPKRAPAAHGAVIFKELQECTRKLNVEPLTRERAQFHIPRPTDLIANLNNTVTDIVGHAENLISKRKIGKIAPGSKRRHFYGESGREGERAPVGLVLWDAGILHAVGRGANKKMNHAICTNGDKFSEWLPVDGIYCESGVSLVCRDQEEKGNVEPAAKAEETAQQQEQTEKVAKRQQTIDAFVTGTDGAVYHNRNEGSHWKKHWSYVPESCLLSAPAACTVLVECKEEDPKPNGPSGADSSSRRKDEEDVDESSLCSASLLRQQKILVFGASTENQLVYTTSLNKQCDKWTAWNVVENIAPSAGSYGAEMDVQLASTPAVCTTEAGDIHVFCRDERTHFLCHKWLNHFDNDAWSKWRVLDSKKKLTSSPAACCSPDGARIDVLATYTSEHEENGSGSSPSLGALLYKRWERSTWKEYQVDLSAATEPLGLVVGDEQGRKQTSISFSSAPCCVRREVLAVRENQTDSSSNLPPENNNIENEQGEEGKKELQQATETETPEQEAAEEEEPLPSYLIDVVIAVGNEGTPFHFVIEDGAFAAPSSSAAAGTVKVKKMRSMDGTVY